MQHCQRALRPRPLTFPRVPPPRMPPRPRTPALPLLPIAWPPPLAPEAFPAPPLPRAASGSPPLGTSRPRRDCRSCSLAICLRSFRTCAPGQLDWIVHSAAAGLITLSMPQHTAQLKCTGVHLVGRPELIWRLGVWLLGLGWVLPPAPALQEPASSTLSQHHGTHRGKSRHPALQHCQAPGVTSCNALRAARMHGRATHRPPGA